MKVTKDEVKKRLIEFNGGKSSFGAVFDAVCETIAFYAPEQPEKPTSKKSTIEVDKGT